MRRLAEDERTPTYGPPSAGGPWRIFGAVLVALIFGVACGGEGNAPGATRDSAGGETADTRDAADADEGEEGSLCGRISDDEALTPEGAELLESPGLQEANNQGRCIFAFGLDMAIEEVRGFYRETLGDLGYEIVHYDESDGIARGNLSRTFLRASKPGMQLNLQADEFDPEESGISEHTVNVKLQFDRMGG